MLLPAPRPIPISTRAHLPPPHFHSRSITLLPPGPAALSTTTTPAATRPRKRGSLCTCSVPPPAATVPPVASPKASGSSWHGDSITLQHFSREIENPSGLHFVRIALVHCNNRYLLALDNNPIAAKAVTSALLTLAGDLICQLVLDRVPELNLKRTFVLTFLGLSLVGPTLHFIFSPIFIGVFMSLLGTYLTFFTILGNWFLAANFIALAWNVILSFKAHEEIVAK